MLHILIVDDSPEDRLILRRFLARQARDAYTITEVDRGDRALAAFQTDRPDCVLLDYLLPDMDGLAALTAIRAQSDVPVVILTGVGSEALAVEALHRGAQDYLVKGALSPERLGLTIQQAIATVRLARERDQTLTLLATVLDGLPVGAAVLDADLRIRQGNPALARMLGQPLAALYGQALPMRWPDQAEGLAALCGEVLRGTPFQDLELHLPAAAGRAECWLVISGTPVRATDGVSPLVLVTAQDITARRQAEVTRRASEAHFRALIELGTEGMALLGSDGQLRYGSPGLATLLGCRPEAVTALRLRDLCHPDDQLQLIAFLDALAHPRGGAAQVTVRLRHQGGRWRWIALQGCNQTDFPALAALIVSFHDVTAWVEAEQTAQAAARRLQILAAAARAFAEAATDEPVLLEQIARLTAEPLAASCVIWRTSADALSLRPGVVYDRDPAVQAILNAGFLNRAIPAHSPHPAAAVARSGHPLLIPVIDPESIRAVVAPELWPTFERIRPHSTIVVPLRARGATLGSLVFTRHESGQPAFSADDLTLVQDLADRAALALAHARLYQQAQAAEQTAAEALARLDALLRSVPSGIGYLDRDLRYQIVNPALAALNDRAPEAHIGRTPHEVIPSLAPRLEPLLRQVLATGAAMRDLELHGQFYPTGEAPHNWLVSYFPVHEATGAVAGVGVIVTDITVSRRTAAALQDTERKLSTLFELLPVGVSILDATPRLVYVNAAAERIVRMDRSRLLQGAHRAISYRQADGALLPPEAQAAIQALLERQPFTSMELGFTSEAGEEVWTSVSTVPVDFPDWRVVMVTTDITARKQAELALAAHAEALSRSNAELARALQLKDEFLAMMSHELRTPLNAVLGLTEGLGEELYGPIAERQRQALTAIVSSARHLLAILSDIMDLAYLESGNAPLDLQPIDVDVLCRAALQFVQAPAQAKGIQLRRTVVFGIDGLRADTRRLTQILTNLLDNAVKFTPPRGQVGLEVTADATQEVIAFTVWDTGIGIAPADHARLFQPFTQVDGRLARQYEGIGLGLTMVRRLVELHGGSVGVESTPGQGSRFTVRLPWSPEENIIPTVPRAPTPQAAAWATPPRLVIADDHELTLQIYGDLLRHQGCAVALARTGAEAVAHVRATRPALAVLDMQMPELDGLGAIRQIRADPVVGATPIIALTALAMPGDRERCLAAGANRYLAKPVGIRALMAAITETLVGAGPTGE